jgi:hypothetical protein
VHLAEGGVVRLVLERTQQHLASTLHQLAISACQLGELPGRILDAVKSAVRELATAIQPTKQL